MQPMTSGMEVDLNINIQVLEVKLSTLTIREAKLEAAVQQLTHENTQHTMEIERLNELLKPSEAGDPTVEQLDAALEAIEDMPPIEVTE